MFGRMLFRVRPTPAEFGPECAGQVEPLRVSHRIPRVRARRIRNRPFRRAPCGDRRGRWGTSASSVSLKSAGSTFWSPTNTGDAKRRAGRSADVRSQPSQLYPSSSAWCRLTALMQHCSWETNGDGGLSARPADDPGLPGGWGAEGEGG